MSFLGPTELKNILADIPIITDGNGENIYNENRVEEAAYALSLGNEVYRTDNKDRKIEVLNENSRTVEINPGQFSLLMTEEYICIPKDKLAFISIKAKHKLKGLINVSGFHVDPGFKGKLLFSVYNAGPSTITLETQKPYFLIWFTNLESEAKNEDEYNELKNHHQGQKHIPIEYVDALKSGEISSPSHLSKQIDLLNNRINNVETSKNLKNEKLFWIFSTILGLVTTFNFVYWNRSSQYLSGYNDAVRLQEVDKLIKENSILLNDSLTLHKIDSLINNRLSNKAMQDAN